MQLHLSAKVLSYMYLGKAASIGTVSRLHWYGGVTVLRTAGLDYLEVGWTVLYKVLHWQ
jgi:hypothetical protein